MNSGANRFTQRVQHDVDSQGGAEAFRLHALKNLQLKTIVRESHQTPVKGLQFNQTDESLENLLASVGGNQATIYNNRYLEHHINVVAQFTNEETTEMPGGDLLCCCWVCIEEEIGNPYGDAVLAVSGTDMNITIISLVDSKVLCTMRGHEDSVTQLDSLSHLPGLVASLAKNGESKIWNCITQECLFSTVIQASCMAWAGELIYFGYKKGIVSKMNLKFSKNRNGSSISIKSARDLDFGDVAPGGMYPVDNLLALPGDMLAIRWSDGSVLVWEVRSNILVSKFKVMGCGLGFGGPVCGMGSSTDGEIICAGNISSTICMYKTRTGERISKLEIDRIRGVVQNCVMSNDGMWVLGTVGNGFIFRFEYQAGAGVGMGGLNTEGDNNQGNEMEGVEFPQDEQKSSVIET